MTLTFFVPGLPRPQAALRAFVIRDKVTGRPRPILTHASKGLAPWRATVALAASQALTATAQTGWLGREAVKVAFDFRFPRPPSHPKRIPPLHVVRPDVDHLIRGCNDGLTGVLWRDDSQIVEVTASKRYAKTGETVGVSVWVEKANG